MNRPKEIADRLRDMKRVLDEMIADTLKIDIGTIKGEELVDLYKDLEQAAHKAYHLVDQIDTVSKRVEDKMYILDKLEKHEFKNFSLY